MSHQGWGTNRRLVVLAIVLLLIPTVVAGVTQALDGGVATQNGTAAEDVDDLTIVASQGRSPEAVQSAGGLEIINTTSKEQVWNHGRQRCIRYYDTDPIDNSTLLFSANCRGDEGNRIRLGFEYNWRTDTVLRVFLIPYDTHDVDKLGPHRYAVANIGDQSAYVYNYTAGDPISWESYRGHEVRGSWNQVHEWEYNFTDRYPESDGGPEDYSGDYTHLNDIDSVDNGSAFLLSPRDFNRVMLIDRDSKEVRWTLGEQYDTRILNGQHHPALLDTDPPTLLVGDSLNHRVVEYQRLDGEWQRTWTYSRGLNWPRSVARLPNGNTLITDTGNNRIVEVRPNGTVEWEYDTTYPNPYGAVRYAHGDEGGGPTMAELEDGNSSTETQPTAGAGGVSVLEQYHRLAGFVLPAWVGKWEFASLVGALALAIGWTLSEIGLKIRRQMTT